MSVDDSTSLRDLVRHHLDESDTADLGAVADAVAVAIPDGMLRSALAECLRVFVRVEAGSLRSAAHRAVSPTVKSKWTGVGDVHRSVLRTRESVSPGCWKFLGDMVRDEVLYVAAQRIANGEASIAAGRCYERLAQLMSSTQAVADLPESLVAEVFA